MRITKKDPALYIRPSDRTVYCIGETVLDIIFKDHRVIAAKPGGSMLNAAVSLGRAGVCVEFISEIATDLPGEMIISFLQENHVGTSCIRRHTEGKTTLALAFLNERADAIYSFYSDPPRERLTQHLPVPTGNDIVLFGSFYSLDNGLHEKLKPFLIGAGQNKALILYDPNFRKAHLADLPHLMPRIRKNFSFADVIRGSDEDFLHIFAVRDPGDAYDRVRTMGTQVLIYTRSDQDVCILTGEQTIFAPVPKIEPVSTIGAGDSFNAGLIHALISTGTGKGRIPLLAADDWERITGNAIKFSQNVCMNLDNYISLDFIPSLEK